MKQRSNLILIGMPGSGKSTVGRMVARTLQRPFVDSDDLIEQRQGLGLQQVVDALGPDGFQTVEKQVLMGIDLQGHVIATGGSAVYSHQAMLHLHRIGVLLFLDAPLTTLQRRLTNMDSRGIMRLPGQSLPDLFDQRRPLYQRYAHHVVETSGLTVAQTCDQVCGIAAEYFA